MTRIRLWLRWTWRDLRERWLQVTAIALIIALGTGVYAGMGSARPWREQSYDDSYALLNMYDLRVQFPSSSYVDADAALDALANIPHADQIVAVEPRLLVPTLVEATTEDDTILVPGRIMGVRMGDGGPQVNGIHLMAGAERRTAGDDPRAILEYNFAAYHDLPETGTIRVSGGVPVEYAGHGMTPELFMVVTETIGFKEEANFALVMMPLDRAQAIAGYPGMANDFVLTTHPGADLAVLRAEIEAAFDRAFSGPSVQFMERADDTVYSLLYGDLDSDDEMFKLIAYLFLAGAAFGTFNLASRIVESQRRQIGIGMALGVRPALLAVRPLLVGAQIALLGVVFGLVLGGVISAAFAQLIRDYLPMPVFEAPFQVGIFAQAALLGVALPFAATIYPVLRAVRVTPVDAIRTGHLIAKGGGLAPLLARLPLPGRSFTQMPLRNLLRAPRRTLLTLLGVAMAITTLIALFSMLDSFLATVDAGEREFLQDTPDRLVVTLNTFYAVTAPQVEGVRASELLDAAEPGILLGGELRHEGKALEVSVELLDLDGGLWVPTLVEGSLPGDEPGILINEKAARDLGVEVGDTLTLYHPRRTGLFSFRAVETPLVVSGIHASPLRFLTYLPLDEADLFGLEGMANQLYVNPAPGVSQGDVQHALFSQPGVASVRAVSALTRAFSSMLDMLISIMAIAALAVMALAFLIAFNSTSINVDERRREIATLFAFGLPLRTVVRMAMVENLITGALGTVSGVALGYGVMVWMMDSRVANMLPDVHLTLTVSTLSLALAVLLGVVVVALTPLLNIRKLARMNLPSALRVME